MAFVISNAMDPIRTRQGKYSLRVTGSDGSVRNLHSGYDPEGEAVGIVDAFSWTGEGVLVVLGLGMGYHVHELSRRYPGADIVVIEGMQEIHDLCGKYGKGADLTGRVRFILGATPTDAVAEISRHHLKAGLPPLAVFPFAPEVAAFPEYYGPIKESLAKTVSFRFWDKLRYTKFRADRLTVALFDYGYFLTEEIARAVKTLGHSVVRVQGRTDESYGDIIGRAVETIATHKPDFFLTVNHLGFDRVGGLTDLFRAIEMPAAIWYVDSPNLVVKAFPKNGSPFSSIFLWDESYLGDMKSLGFEYVSSLPLAADESVFRPQRVSSTKRRKTGAGVGFVGNSMVRPTRDQLLKVPEKLHAAVEKMARRLCGSRGVPFAEAAWEAMSPAEREDFELLGAWEMSEFEAAVLWRATLLYRLSCLRTLEEFRPCIRGDAGWKELVNGKFRLGPRLNYYKELPFFYNACTVNFNATSIQMGKAVNQRVFDVPACGSFLLTDHQESVEGLFEVGKEVVTYKDRGEIADLVRFYLHNDTARETIAGKGRERVLAEHTYRHRIETITRRLREVYG